MQSWLEWARGPFFRFALAFMILGLARALGVAIWQAARALRQAGDRRMPWRALARTTRGWMIPARKLGARPLYSTTTFIFHLSILIVPLFLAGHIALIRRGFGVSWPSIPHFLADVLTLAAIITSIAIVIQRAAMRSVRQLSTFQDYALPLIIAVPFLSGFLVTHPWINPFPFDPTMLVHMMSANIVMILVPITKISHCILLPLTQVVSELGWHFTPDAGQRLAAKLDSEREAAQ